MKALISLTLSLLALLPSVALANSITDTQVITSDGVGSVGYTYFSQDAEGTTSIETTTDNFDASIYVFVNDGSLDTGDLYSLDDDSGSPSAFGPGAFNAFISELFDAGDYIVAVSDYFLSIEDAVAGINTDAIANGLGSGSYDLTITSTANVNLTPVPEPATMLLLGTGLAGVAAVRRRRQNKQQQTKILVGNV